VLALVIGMLLVAWTQTPRWKREGILALAALVIAGALAVLGIATPGARLPAITLGNLLGGYALLAVLAAAAAPASVASRGARNLARLALAFVFVQAALGGMIGAQFASLACPAFTDCGAWSWTAFAEGGSWNPLRAPDLSDGHLTARDGAAGLHVLHRWNALVTAALIVATAGSLRRSRPRLALALAALVAIAVALGASAVAAKPALVGIVAHNASAALLVALLASAMANPRRGGATVVE